MRPRRASLVVVLGCVTGALASIAARPARAAGPEGHQLARPAPDAASLARGAALVRRGECARCHDTTGLPGVAAFARALSCAGCHAWIHATADDADALAREGERFPKWDRYVEHVHSYLAVPSLAAAGARLEPEWVSRFLRAPYKIRPGFTEAMIREPLTPRDADDIAAFLNAGARAPEGAAARAAVVAPSSAAADVAEGERLYASLGCASCHAFGARASAPGLPEAPDLAHARERMRPPEIAAFIADPTQGGLRRETRMPTYPLDARQIARLRDFLVFAPVAAPATATTEAELPLLERRVSWEEVNERVFSAVCSHCHSDGRLTKGDGGAGNTGGLGFRGAGLDLSSWAGVRRGARGADGRRVSILVAAPGEAEAPLVARLRRRVVEHAAERARGAAPGAVGMPLGLPPLDAERLQLVRSWVAQGAPGPAQASRDR